MTGIWQSVWLEAVGGTYLDHVRMVPDIDKGTLCIDYWLSGFEPGLTLKCDVSLDEPAGSESHHRYRREAHVFSQILSPGEMGC